MPEGGIGNSGDNTSDALRLVACGDGRRVVQSGRVGTGLRAGVGKNLRGPELEGFALDPEGRAPARVRVPEGNSGCRVKDGGARPRMSSAGRAETGAQTEEGATGTDTWPDLTVTE